MELIIAAVLITGGFGVLLEAAKLLFREKRRDRTASACLVQVPGKEYLMEYALAFRKLAASYQQMPHQKAQMSDRDRKQIAEAVKASVCAECSYAEACGGDYAEAAAAEALAELEREAGELTEALPYGCTEERQGFGKMLCFYDQYFRESVKRQYLEARTAVLWRNRMLEQRAAAGEQMEDTARVLEQMASELDHTEQWDYLEYHRLRKELGYEHILLNGAWKIRRPERSPELFLRLKNGGEGYASAAELAELVSEVIGEAVIPARDCRRSIREKWELFHLVPEVRYQMMCGIAKMTKDGELVSGDNFSFWQGKQGQVIMSLADGMGSGMDANRESEKVIELLEQFLDAGFTQETAMHMLNASMLLQDQTRTFSTIDLCMVDLYNGKCKLMKAGACSSFLSGRQGMDVIRCERLPAGILRTEEFRAVERQIQAGDLIVMMTDGVLDALGQDGGEKKMTEIIGRIDVNHAGEFAGRLLEQVIRSSGTVIRDDMTVLVGRIWNKTERADSR